MQGRKRVYIFSQDQREKLRNALLQAYKNAQKEEKWNWSSTAERIEEYFEHNIPDSVRNKWPKPFCYETKVNLGRSDNFARFAQGKVIWPGELTLLAIACWLTSEDARPWSDLTEEKLYDKPILPKAAQYLKDFLYENVEEKPDLYAELLTGSFEFHSDATSLYLTVHCGENEHTLSICIDEVRSGSSGTGGKSETEDFRYEGWIVISPNDSLFCVLKNQTEKSNHLYIPLGVNEKESWADEPVKTLLFLNQPIAEQFCEADIGGGGQNILNIWLSGKSNNVLIFHRVI
ncbi:MAG: hypothetical protein E6Q59_04405 [Nitrosomonas sp.]|nr:hypothetical protein [Nitrosomonas sp.]OQW85465.1 MAG: hypothetical protein BVN30_00710 [Proteobacteria bacterium ST_bin16]TXI39750.1 MAG: hypothetical protein E6Q59_04405 [Nitrosomonas sp.]